MYGTAFYAITVTIYYTQGSSKVWTVVMFQIDLVLDMDNCNVLQLCTLSAFHSSGHKHAYIMGFGRVDILVVMLRLAR